MFILQTKNVQNVKITQCLKFRSAAGEHVDRDGFSVITGDNFFSCENEYIKYMESISKILFFSSGVTIHKTLPLRFLPDEAHLKYVNKHINRHLKEGENHSLVYEQMCLKQEQLFKKELPHDKIIICRQGMKTIQLRGGTTLLH